MREQSKLLKILFLFLGWAIFISASAQELSITGKVTDFGDGQPIPGVTVVIKGTTTGTVTTFDGSYFLKAKAGDILSYSFVGYTTQEVVLSNQTVINMVLKSETIGMDEVVVIGYGQVKKSDATGAVNVIGADDFQKGAITSPQALIMGKTPGVIVTTNNGAPGSGATIRIRGGSSLQASNNPLIVIDGLPLDDSGLSGLSNPLSTINPNDIESMSILKDASATAIYGSRASNGVILITTKKGKKEGVNFSYNGNLSVGQVVKTIDLFNGDDFRALVQDRVDYNGLSAFALTRLGEDNTDWQKEIYRTSISNDHNISVFGNVDNVPFRASVGQTFENGILKESGLSRTTISLNASPSFINNTLKVNLNAKYMDILNNFSNTDAIGSAVEFDPTQPIRNGNTRYGGYTAWIELSEADQLNGLPINIATHNPVARLKYRDNQADANRFIGNAQFDYSIPFVTGLRANLNLGYDKASSEGYNNTDLRASWSLRSPNQNRQNYNQTIKNELLDFYLNYNTEIDAHKVDVTAGYGWQHFYNEGGNMARSWDESVEPIESSYKGEYFLVSFFGRINYSLLDRYLVTATVRNDGSSRFSEENRWGLFPAFAFAWKINNEPIFESLEQVNELKLRLGYGITGQQNIPGGFYPYIPVYRMSEPGAYYQFGDDFYPTLRPDAYDANLKWEETTTYNIGLDFGFYNNRLSGSFDAYSRETVDLISRIPIPAGTNNSNFLTTNVGSLENKGFEAALNYRIISQKDMSWEVGANFSYNVNEITSLSKVKSNEEAAGYDLGGISGGVGNNVQRNSVGNPANSFYLFKQVYDVNGMPIEGLYIDKTGLGGVVSGNNDNKYYLGTPAPDYMIGISSKFEFKQFDFSFAGRLSMGNYVYNNTASNRAIYQNIYNQSGYLSNIPRDVLKSNFTNAQYWSDFYLEDASFFRMDNISLGYTFNNMFDSKLSGRVSGTVQNAFVISDYSGLDPEVDGGIDNNIYPRPRIFMLGVNINF
jgi:iron complex outermembrane receptor protein